MSKQKFKRAILIVMDSVGVGHDPRAKEFNDDNPNTLLHIDHGVDGLYV